MTSSTPRPNARLTETISGLPPGEALELGCGNGGDALWLAERGWRVTAVDLAAEAVQRLVERAHGGGLGARVTAVRLDLRESFPDGAFDLVCAHYLHAGPDLDRAAVFRAAGRALRPGGVLLVVDHGSTAPWSWNQDPDVRYPSAAEVAAGIGLDPVEWPVLRAEALRRRATGPGGQRAEVVDHLLLIRRAA